MSITPVTTPTASTSPNRDTQNRDVFNANMAACLVDFLNLHADLVVSIPEMNTDIAAAVAASQIAVGAANYDGEWSVATGAKSEGQSYSHNGSIYMLKADVADITAVEPGVTGGWATTYQLTYEPVSVATGEHYIKLTTANGHGSVNDHIRRFTTTVTSVGSDIVYADSAADGASFTIQEDGIYWIGYQDVAGGTVDRFGFSRNSNQLTTDINSITAAHVLSMVQPESASETAFASWAGYLEDGDVIRPHTDGDPNSTSAIDTFFIISKIGQ